MTDIDTVSFLEHHGVKGMKWGVIRKSKEERHTNRIARGEKKFGKSKSTAGVVGRVVGRELLREVGMFGANVALSKIPASPQVKSGARFAMSAANVGFLVRDIRDASAYTKSKR